MEVTATRKSSKSNANGKATKHAAPAAETNSNAKSRRKPRTGTVVKKAAGKWGTSPGKDAKPTKPVKSTRNAAIIATPAPAVEQDASGVSWLAAGKDYALALIEAKKCPRICGKPAS